MSTFNFQRCIDGELSEAEEAAFLRDLGHDTSQWRQLALMFIEDRLLRRTLQGAHIPVPVSQPQVQTPQIRPQQAESWRALATYLALSLVVGVALGGAWVQWKQGRAGSAAPMAMTEDTGQPSGPSSLQPPVAVSPDVLSKVAIAPLPADAESLTIPVYHNKQLPRDLFKSPRMIPVEVERELLRRGLTVDQQRQFLYLELENGQRALVPQDTFKVRYAVQ